MKKILKADYRSDFKLDSISGWLSEICEATWDQNF